MPEQIRVGFIGCGNIANRHIGQFSGIPGVEIVAISDVTTRGLERHKEEYPFIAELPFFTDYREMFDKIELDVVSINTPHMLHFQHIMDSLDRGLHVAVEKPMVCCVDDAKKIIARSKETGLKVSVTYQRRFWPEFLYLRQFIKNGDLGKVEFISATQCQGWYNPARFGWRQSKEMGGGGQLNDSGSHLIDSVLYAVDLEPEEVFAYIDNLACDVDINSAISIKFKGGARANISIMGNAPTKGVEEQINIGGEKGVILYHNKEIVFFNKMRESHTPELPPAEGNPDKNLIDAILGKDEIKSPPEGFLRVIQLTEAVWKSAETGCPVKVEE